MNTHHDWKREALDALSWGSPDHKGTPLGTQGRASSAFALTVEARTMPQPDDLTADGVAPSICASQWKLAPVLFGSVVIPFGVTYDEIAHKFRFDPSPQNVPYWVRLDTLDAPCA